MEGDRIEEATLANSPVDEISHLALDIGGNQFSRFSIHLNDSIRSFLFFFLRIFGIRFNQFSR